MESPLSFNSSENFRKKLLVRNLKPYKIKDNFNSEATPGQYEFTIVDYSVVDTPTVDVTGSIQEKLLQKQNKYSPSQNGYGNTVNINVNYGTQSNNGIYGYNVAYNSKLSEIGDNKEKDLIVKNTYKPQLRNGDYGSTVWYINNDNTIFTTGSGEYSITDTINNLLEQKGNDKEIELRVKNLYKPSNSDNYGTTRYDITNVLTIPTSTIFNKSGGEYTINSTINNEMEFIGNRQEGILRTKNKYNPENILNGFGDTRYDINNDLNSNTNYGEYDFSDTIGSLLEKNGTYEKNIQLTLNQYTPENGQSINVVNPNINYNTATNEGNYTATDAIGSNLETIGLNEKNIQITLNQYNSEKPTKNSVNPNLNQQTNSNEGEYGFLDTIGAPLEVEGRFELVDQTVINIYKPSFNNASEVNPYPVLPVNPSGVNTYGKSDTIGSQLEQTGTIKEKEAYVKNKYVTGDGKYETLTIDDIIFKTTGEPYINSSQSFVFLPSTYTPVSLLLEDNPSGSDGRLSQDSALASIGAKQLKKEFKYRIAAELLSETLGRVNALNSSINPDSGEISVKPKLDPFNAVGIVSGNIPLLVRNYRVTSPDLAIGKALNFAAKLSGLYSPYSIIPGEYFDYPQRKGLNQFIENPIAPLVKGVFSKIRSLTSLNINTGSELLLANTSSATRDLLFEQLFYNEYRPDYKLNSLRNPNLFSPKGNFYIGTRKNDISEITSPKTDLPLYKDGEPRYSPVYGFGEVSKVYEGEKLNDIYFGLNSRNDYDAGYINGTKQSANVSIAGGFTWTSKNSYFTSGEKIGPNGSKGYGETSIYSSGDLQTFQKTESWKIKEDTSWRENSILDVTQKLVDAADNVSSSSRFKHVGTAINQVSKVFNDGYTELTKGSKVVRYTTKTSIDPTKNGKAEGFEYCRIFTKDTPYYTYNQLQKTDGNIRKFTYSVLDNTYNLNIAPMKDAGSTRSSNIVDGKVKKYMFSLENLAWRTSNRPGFTVEDLPACEIGPNGGRIMWFPPYNLSFDESSKPEFTPTTFLGRPEPIFTYKSTTRSGSISWKILVDHPSITNLLIDQELKDLSDDSEVTKIINSFFAGCLKYDIYDLAKRYRQFSLTDIQNAVNTVKTIEEVKKITKEQPPSEPKKQEEPVTIDQKKYGDIILFFDQSDPTKMEPDKSYDVLYSEFNNNTRKSQYQLNAQDIVFKYVNNSKSILDDVTNFNLQEYIDTRNTSLSEVFNFADKKYNNFKTFLTDVGTLLDSGGKISFDIVGSANSVGGAASNNLLSQRRISSVMKFIKEFNSPANKKLNNYIESGTLKIKDTAQGTDAVINEENFKDLNCGTFKFEPGTASKEGTYSVQAMLCRRVKIQNIVPTPAPIKETEVKPETSGVDTNAAEESATPTTTTPQNQYVEPKVGEETKSQLTKKLLRKLLTECSYFEMIEKSNPFLYKSIKSKFKNFHPAFHSVTPEGLNSRLTFLQQCVRPGDTIPTVKQSDNGTITLDYNDAFNSAFGAPPILVLRIGDFWHTKIVPDSLSLKYEEAKFDLNPEGIGVQPMTCDVTLSFSFIGGSGLAGPISKLQNGLSFNFYANTEMYDERADETESIDTKYTSEILNDIKNEVGLVKQKETPNTNEIGNTIGMVLNSGVDTTTNTIKGDITYKDKMNEIVNSVKNYTNATYKSLKEINDELFVGGLIMYTDKRDFQDGTMNGTDTKIYGKSTNYQSKINELVTTGKNDVDSGLCPILPLVDTQNFKNNDVRKIKRKIQELISNKESILNSLFGEKDGVINGSENDLIKNIDKLNYVTSNQSDGFINNRGSVVIYGISGTSQVDAGSTSPNTLNEMITDYGTLTTDLNSFLTKINDYQIIPNGTNNTYDRNFLFNVYLEDDISKYSAPETRFFMLFGKEIITNVDNFVNSIVIVISDNTEKTNWINYLRNSILGGGTNSILYKYTKSKTKSDENFKKFFDEFFNTKFVQYVPFNKDRGRLMTFEKNESPSTTLQDDLKKLGESLSSTGDKFNLKQF